MTEALALQQAGAGQTPPRNKILVRSASSRQALWLSASLSSFCSPGKGWAESETCAETSGSGAMSASANLHDVWKTRLPLGVSCNQCLHRAVLEHDSRLRQASPRPEVHGR